MTSSPVSRRDAARWPHPLAALAFFVGAVLCNCFLSSQFEWSIVYLSAAVCTVAWLASGFTTSRRRSRRLLGYAALAGLAAWYALWIYLAVAFTTLLAWTVQPLFWALILLASGAAAATITRPRHTFHVPVALPLGIAIATLLSGWLREEELTRCDDLLALAPPVELAVASHPDLAACRPGEVRPTGRFPRTIWEAPQGGRVVFTTQGSPIAGGIDGSFCEAELAGGAPPRCVGPPVNKSQGLVELPERDLLLGMQWGLQTPSGARGAAVFAFPRQGALRILETHWFDKPLGDGFYEPRNQTLYLFSDEMDGVYPVSLPSFAVQAKIPVRFAPGELRYDAQRGEGVACGSATGAAIRGAPFALRLLAEGSDSPLERISATWGCDWDAETRKVYTTIPNLGLLNRVDYDSGQVDKRWYVGLGMRSVAYDRVRRRVYFSNFLRGEVFALDEESGAIVGRWFVGRFSRWVRLSRDGRALLATSNLGIMRIPLDAAPAAPR